MDMVKFLRRFLGWMGKILLVILGLMFVLVAYGLIKEAITRRHYRAEMPPPGQMVSLPTHNLHLDCTGIGNPVVVFEADLDQYGSLSWRSVQPAVGEITRSCSYDRAGILWSDPGPRPRDGETIARELSALLEAAGEEGPYVLVGHAFGGAYVRIFAGQNTDDVCGMVLVDSSHPDMLVRFAELGIPQEIPEKSIRPLIWLFSHMGMPGRFKGPRYGLDDLIYNTQQAYLPKSSLAWFDESVASPVTLRQSGMVESLGDIPLIVLASTRPTSVQVEGKNTQDYWLELQQDLADLSNQGELRALPEAGHYIQYDSPAVVVEAIDAVIDACREAPK